MQIKYIYPTLPHHYPHGNSRHGWLTTSSTIQQTPSPWRCRLLLQRDGCGESVTPTPSASLEGVGQASLVPPYPTMATNYPVDCGVKSLNGSHIMPTPLPSLYFLTGWIQWPKWKNQQRQEESWLRAPDIDPWGTMAMEREKEGKAAGG